MEDEAWAPPTEEPLVFTVTDLKQYTYCPRVVYYTYCLPLLRPETYKMEESQEAHSHEAEREERRSLKAYGLAAGERAFEVSLKSTRLGLRGKVDLVITTASERIPVDYKQSTHKAGVHFKLQLAAYGVMLEEDGGLPVRRGFLYAMPLRRAEEVSLTRALRGQVERMTADMRRMVQREQMPPAPKGRGRCLACEFRRFCDDL